MPMRELTPDEESRLLTHLELVALPAGTAIMVKWDGGNGPHRYMLGFQAYDPWAVLYENQSGPGVPPEPVAQPHFIAAIRAGRERWRDRVFLAEAEHV